MNGWLRSETDSEGSPVTLAFCLIAIGLVWWFVFWRVEVPVRAQPSIPATPPPSELVGRWDLIGSVNGSKIVDSAWFSFGRKGEVFWYNGCNWCNGRARVDGDTIRFFPGLRCSSKGCFGPDGKWAPQMLAGEATGLQFSGDYLMLETPSFDYLFRRFPYSELSRNAWSLYSIEDLQKEQVLTPGRVRSGYHDLYISFDADRSFRFQDLDGMELYGSVELEVPGPQTEGRLMIAYSKDSQRKLAHRRNPNSSVILDGGPDRGRHRQTFTQLLTWHTVERFRVVETVITEGLQTGPSDVLEFISPKRVYRFVPR